jgi:outer membrane lipoprotein-sorting protein
MIDKAKKLSDYIDSLNSEKKPKEHNNEKDTSQMEELFEAVRAVRSLKEPTLPGEDYPLKLTKNIKNKLSAKEAVRKRWYMGIASAAAAIGLIVILNMTLPAGRNNMVYAMERAFKDVKTYHGILVVTETNTSGEVILQSKVEVWADKEGRYYVKGIEGAQKDIITANDGNKKWQIQPAEKEVDLFAAFPDPYRFTFELGKEIEYIKKAVQTKVIGEDTVAGRETVIMEVTPQGGSPYKLWIDKETKMPLQKQFAMEYSLQYKVQYTDIDFSEAVPQELLAYSVPNGYREVNTNPEQVLANLEEAGDIIGFEPKALQKVPTSFIQNSISVMNDGNVVKFNYGTLDKNKKVIVLQKKAAGEFKVTSMAVLGKINDSIAEVQSPLIEEAGVISGGSYAGISGMSSVRWRQEGIEFAVIGNASLSDLSLFIQGLTKGTVELIPSGEQSIDKPEVEVAVDLKAEEGAQRNADAGHSPWKLDPAYVTQVFVSLMISPNGIQGEYPVKYEEIKIVKNNGIEAVAEINADNAPVSKVYLKRLIREDSTGIWTVVGYDK